MPEFKFHSENSKLIYADHTVGPHSNFDIFLLAMGVTVKLLGENIFTE